MTIPVEEGPQAVVASRKIEGAAHVEEEQLQKILGEGRRALQRTRLGWTPTTLPLTTTIVAGARPRSNRATLPDRTAADRLSRRGRMRSFFRKTIVAQHADAHSKLMQLTT